MRKTRTSDIINDLESCDIGGINLGRIKNNELNRKILDKEFVAIDEFREWLKEEVHRSGASIQILEEFEKSLSTSQKGEGTCFTKLKLS